MNPLKLSCLLGFLFVVLAIPAIRSASALPTARMYDAGPAISGSLTELIQAKKKKRARNRCDIEYRDCVAQCKRGSATDFQACASLCNANDWWCQTFCGGTPC
jgi:hypothetical protein